MQSIIGFSLFILCGILLPASVFNLSIQLIGLWTVLLSPLFLALIYFGINLSVILYDLIDRLFFD